MNHIDSDVSNNDKDNLEWVDYKINRQHSQETGNHRVFGEKHSQSKLSEETVHKICSLLEKGCQNSVISKKLEIDKWNVVNIRAGKSWRHVSCQYDIDIPRKKRIGPKTVDWVRFRKESGMSFEDILEISHKMTREDLKRIFDIIRDECND